MRIFIRLVTAMAVAALGASVLAADPQPTQSALKTDAERLSYALGQDIGDRLKAMNAQVDLQVFMKGVEDAVKGNKPLLTAEEANQVKMAFGQKMQEEMAKQRKEQGEKNLALGQRFMEENKRQPGVKVTPSGLQFQVIREGSGDSPTKDDRVTVNYKGTLVDGTEFDSSYSRKQPATFGVSGVISGWTEALQMMKPGGKYRIVIPPNLAYGDRGAGQKIGPNSALVFEIELLSVEKASAGKGKTHGEDD
jgi:FKBP-type peptidyl-prolyl cis-trans isomerase